MNTKQNIRKELLKKRNTLTEEQRKKYSKLIQERLLIRLEPIIQVCMMLYGQHMLMFLHHVEMKKLFIFGNQNCIKNKIVVFFIIINIYI